MIKKFLSVLLAVMMIVSVLAVGFVTADAATTDGFSPKANMFYFDVDGTGWTMGSKNKIAFHIAGGDLDTEANASKPAAWGAKKAIGSATTGETGIFEFDPATKLNLTFTPGVQYKIIFVRTDGANWTNQTCSLYFTTDCLGHVAKCDGTMMENDVDSSKSSYTVYWDDSINPAENGPAMCITSIGNVVGSCVEQGKTKYDLLVDFFAEPKTDFKDKTTYQNAHGYVCEIDPSAPKYKTEQKMVDDIGEGLGLTKDQVKEIIESDKVQATFTETGLGCSWSYADSTLPGGAHEHTPGDPVIENDTPSTCKVAGTYDEVIYCTECGDEISRETKNHELAAHTPGEAKIENDTPSTCKVAGTYDEVVYCTVCGDELSRETKNHELAAHTPGETQIENDTPSTCKVAGTYDEVVYCTVCGDELSRETKNHELAAHTPGEAKIENEKAADCVNGGSYDEVTYCTVCGDEISRETKNTDPDPNAHGELVFVEKVDATASVDGMEAHFECPLCGKFFADETGATEVDPADLVIKAEHIRGDADGNGVFDIADVTALQRKLVDFDVEGFDAIAADADLDGTLDVIDVTLMQRVLANVTTFEKWDARHPKA